jgi:hypothetical protein
MLIIRSGSRGCTVERVIGKGVFGKAFSGDITFEFAFGTGACDTERGSGEVFDVLFVPIESVKRSFDFYKCECRKRLLNDHIEGRRWYNTTYR